MATRWMACTHRGAARSSPTSEMRGAYIGMPECGCAGCGARALYNTRYMSCTCLLYMIRYIHVYGLACGLYFSAFNF